MFQFCWTNLQNGSGFDGRPLRGSGLQLRRRLRKDLHLLLPHQTFGGVGVLPAVSLWVERSGRRRSRRLLFGVVLVAVGLGGAHAEHEGEYEDDAGDGDEGDQPPGDPGLAHLVLGGPRRWQHKDDRLLGHVDNHEGPVRRVGEDTFEMYLRYRYRYMNGCIFCIFQILRYRYHL